MIRNTYGRPLVVRRPRAANNHMDVVGHNHTSIDYNNMIIYFADAVNLIFDYCSTV